MIFIDTGAFVARYIESDEKHRAAVKAWGRLGRERKLHTSQHVIDETITLLRRRTNPPFAIATAENLYQSPALTILRSDAEDECRALAVLKKYADHDLSFTDCLTVALMERHRLATIFTDDAHFRLFHFTIIQ